MGLNPCRHNVVSQEFSMIIDWAFRQSDIDVLLGGSCALSEFYLGHRVPEDIDFFVSKKEDLKAFKTALSQSFKIQREEVIKRASSYRYIVEAGGQDIVVHCTRSEKLKHPKERESYTTKFESIQLHTPDFIGAWKLSRRRQESLIDCTKKVIDLYFLTCAGVTFSDFLSVFYAFKIEPRNMVNWPYQFPYYDASLLKEISLKHLSSSQVDPFLEKFRTEVKAILKDKKQEN